MARKKPLGDCYRWAYQYVRVHPHALLYQGTVTAPYKDAGKKPYEHAWISDGGLVKDWQTMVAGMGGRYKGVGWPEDVWERLWKPHDVRVYSLEQAYVAILKHGHYGPWE